MARELCRHLMSVQLYPGDTNFLRDLEHFATTTKKDFGSGQKTSDPGGNGSEKYLGNSMVPSVLYPRKRSRDNHLQY